MNEAAQPPGFLARTALQLLIAETIILTQLRCDHIPFLNGKALVLGDGHQLIEAKRLLQTRLQMGLLACMRQKGIELFERQRMA